MLEYRSWRDLLTDGENGDAAIALSDEGEYTLSDLRERSASVSAALRDAGVRTAAVCTDDQRRLLESLAGCFMAGVHAFLPNSFDRSHFALVGEHFEAVLTDGTADLSCLSGKRMLSISEETAPARVLQHQTIPPLTFMTCLVTYAASSENRNAT